MQGKNCSEMACSFFFRGGVRFMSTQVGNGAAWLNHFGVICGCFSFRIDVGGCEIHMEGVGLLWAGDGLRQGQGLGWEPWVSFFRLVWLKIDGLHWIGWFVCFMYQGHKPSRQSWKLTGELWKTIFLLGKPFVHVHDCWKEGNLPKGHPWLERQSDAGPWGLLCQL